MNTRVWWRLEDAVPLAEHTMSLPQHGLSTAQVRAGAANQPALIWTAEPDRDALSSNGIPGWFDEQGQPHEAYADHWTHTATGMTSRPRHSDPAHGFLPLTGGGGASDLIGLLRRGARHGAHWFVLDASPTKVRYQVPDHRDDVVPPDVTWVPATVTTDLGALGGYPAQIADGYTALGGVIARFSREVVAQMRSDLAVLALDAMPGQYPRIQMHGDVAVVYRDRDVGVREHRVEVDRVYPDRDGYLTVGAYLWAWHASPAPVDDPDPRG